MSSLRRRATNTSTIDIDLVGAKCTPAARPRILGAHFFSPAHVMQLLEIVRTSSTSPQARASSSGSSVLPVSWALACSFFQTLFPSGLPPQAILDTLELSRRIKKTPVVVGNCTGFAVNRMFFPYTMAACMLVRGRFSTLASPSLSLASPSLPAWRGGSIRPGPLPAPTPTPIPLTGPASDPLPRNPERKHRPGRSARPARRWTSGWILI